MVFYWKVFKTPNGSGSYFLHPWLFCWSLLKESEIEMKPSAYISDGGILFKESPPDSILKLNPLYTSAEIQALHNLVKEQVVEIEGLKQALELSEWDEETWKKFKKDNYEVIELKPRSEK